MAMLPKSGELLVIRSQVIRRYVKVDT